MAKIESALRSALAFNEAYNRHDIAALTQLLSADCVSEHFEPPPDGTILSGRDSVAHFFQDFFQESPHAQCKIEDASGFGERCIMRWKYQWEDASGKQKYVRGMSLFRVKDGLICEILSYVKGALGEKRI